MRNPCWYCHAVTVDACPQCGSSAKEREEIAAFYESFRTFSVTEGMGRSTNDAEGRTVEVKIFRRPS